MVGARENRTLAPSILSTVSSWVRSRVEDAVDRGEVEMAEGSPTNPSLRHKASGPSTPTHLLTGGGVAIPAPGVQWSPRNTR